MGKKIRTEEVDHLFEAILCLKNKEECYTFFEDVCTINELLSLSQRFEVAKMLTDKRTYLDISEKTGGMIILEERYRSAIEDVITINELQKWIDELDDKDIDGIIRDIDVYYKLEMNMNAEDDE